MEELQWKDEYLLGIPAVDLQYKRIFDCFVAIAEAGLTKQDESPGDSSMIQLAGLVHQHFALEEGMMRSFGYPGLERHIEEHRQFLSDVQGLARRSQGTTGRVSHEMIKVFRKWLQEHIMTSDRRYVEYFAGPSRESVGKTAGAR
jgi:hemerythrin-like metal-binding protein